MQTLSRRGHDVMVLTSDYRRQGVSVADTSDTRRTLRLNGYLDRPWLPIRRLYAIERHNQNELRDTIAAFQPDVVHVWNMGGISKSLLHTLEAGSIPVVADVSDHWVASGLPKDVWLSWWNRGSGGAGGTLRTLLGWLGVRRFLASRVPMRPIDDFRFERIYFCSEFLKRVSAEAGHRVGHGAVIYCGVDTQRFKVKQEYSTISRLLWAGRLAEDKDPLTAVRGLARFLGEHPDRALTLDLFGHGSDTFVRKVTAEIKALGLEKQVALKSATADEMYALYAGYDALFFTSNWGEPFALTPLEAMASGLPVIMCPDGGDAELARDEDNCLMFKAGDADSLAEALAALVARDDHGRALAMTALEEARSRFDLSIMVDEIEAYLLASLGGRTNRVLSASVP